MVLHSYEELESYLGKKIFLVCDNSIKYLKINEYFKLKSGIVRFDNFLPNPLYESVVEGVEIFNREKCDTIVAVGGGSAIDVAKCIKLYSNMDPGKNYLQQQIVPNDVPLIAVPTTAGTGSEATRYAVIYYNGEKQSVSDYSCIPLAVLFDESVLETLPEYQKKATMMDALCHAIESCWSVNSNEESRRYSLEAISLIINNYREYLAGDNSKNGIMLQAANIAGKAINIAQTTAGHAMCYKLTSLYGIAHGHAAAICVRGIWPYMSKHIQRCIDVRGKEHLENVFSGISVAMGCASLEEAIGLFDRILNELGLNAPKNVNSEDYEILKNSVNPLRLKNNPIAFTTDEIDKIYHEILGE